MTILRATLLGSFRLWQNDKPLDLGSARLELLLAYLLLLPNRAHPRQTVAFRFWPDSTDAQARTNLRKALYRLRRRWPNSERFLEISAQSIRWQEKATLNVDVIRFRQLLDAAGDTVSLLAKEKLLREAASIGRGALLPGHYDEWVIETREQHRRHYLAALNDLVALQEKRRAYGEAIETARRLLEIDSLHEESYRRLMRLHALSGDRAGALRVYHTCVSRLREELDVEPAPATRQAYEQLLQRNAQVPSPAHRRLPLVARHEEWNRLQKSWREAARGAPQAVLISGEAGIGKTRLSEEMEQWAARQGHTVLHTACYAAEKDVPYSPLTSWLRSDAVQTRLDTVEDVWLTELSRLLPEISARFPRLGVPEPLETAWQRRHLFTAVARAVEAAGDPLLFSIDDLHWCDPESIAWLGFLLRRRRRLLLLGTVRQEEVNAGHPLRDWQRELQHRNSLTELPLARLDLKATLELAGHVGASLGDTAGRRLFAETEGNPLFVVEWIRSGAAAGRSSPADNLPDRVHALLDARLSRLSPSARDLAGGAALIGRSFSGRLLAAAGELDEDQLVDGVDELWQQQIIREQGMDAYDFTHNKLRQVAASALPPGRKQRWHRRIITALRRQHRDDLRPVHEQLARHYRAVGLRSEAMEHFHAAAGAAAQIFAHREAIAHLRRALDLAEGDQPAGSKPIPRQTVAALHEDLGDALALRGERSAARRAYHHALELLETEQQRAELWLKIGQSRLREHTYQEAERALRRAATVLGDPGATPEARRWKTWLDIQLAHIDRYYFQARLDELDRLCAQIERPILAHGNAAQKASYFTSLVMAAHRRQRFISTEQDIDHQRQALVWASSTGQTHLVTRMTFSLGFTLLCGGALDEAAAALEEAVARSRREGNRPVLNQSLAYLTITRRFQGSEAQVRELLDQALPLAMVEENPFYLGAARANQAWLAYRGGNFTRAAQRAREAMDHWSGLAYPLRGLALWPRLAAALATEQWSAAAAAARSILHPEQQNLTPQLNGLLQKMGETPNDSNLHAELVIQARAAGYL